MGHDYPVFLKFKGGKGIATTAAAMMAFDWRIGLCCFIIFVTVTAVTKYVSLASGTLLSAGIVSRNSYLSSREDGIYLRCVSFMHFLQFIATDFFFFFLPIFALWR